MTNHTQIGRRLPLLDAEAKATGQARYSSDVVLPRMLYGKILRSTLPHARLLRVDTSQAERLAGVKAVVTGRDTSGVKYGNVVVPEGFRDRLALAIDKVRYIGDEIAAVAAVDEDTAQEALGLIEVEFEELPAVFDPEEAMKPGAPQIHAHVERNISRRQLMEFGDVAKSFRDAYLVREDQFATQATSHVPLETHGCVAMYESPCKLTLWTSTQVPFYVQDDLAMTLKMPRGDIRVIKPVTGGGFGGKADGMDATDFCASLLSIKTGRPVRVANTREEEFSATRRRHPMIIRLKTAVARDGTLLAKECHLILDGGAYNHQGPITPMVFSTRFMLPYRQEAIRCDASRVYTNKSPSSAMRGFGSPQIHFAQDVQMDLIAGDLGVDPLELRLKNGLETGETTISGFHIFSSGFRETLRRVRGVRVPTGVKAGDALAGWGLGCTGFPCGTGRRSHSGSEAYSGATVVAHEDGSVTLLTGAADVGQGSNTTLSQIVAEELAIPLERVKTVSADTAITPRDFGAYSSRTTMMAGNAALEAARRVKEQLLDATAQALEANVSDLVLKDGRIEVKGSPERGLTFAEAVVGAHRSSAGRDVKGEGAFIPVTAEGSPSWSFGTNAAHVEIDRETGQVVVRRMAVARDSGVEINPMAVEGQIEGSVHMGIGFALTEELMTQQGQVLNPSLLDYKVVTPLEMPPIDVLRVDVTDPVGPFGAKEVGEGAVGPNAPAIANAILHAAGIQVKTLPIKSERVLEALKETS
ncbi:MAG: molybdopterin-dependent oxidoreductase [Dehalococcoidia bacterium]|nr:molybdopterin-dependent oxidoreductase [Dehalococcoidia bacterium]